jgi:hemerythrin-like domain-containing protein
MDPFDLLSEEHRLIAAATDAFEGYVACVELEDAVDREDLRGFVQFFGDFVELGHHDKEESILLPALVKHGFSWDDGPLAVIRKEHSQERYLLAVLSHAAHQSDEWDAEARRRFISFAREFIRFLRAHMEHEEARLFPAGRKGLSEQTSSAISRLFVEFESSQQETRSIAHARALVDSLCKRYSTSAY